MATWQRFVAALRTWPTGRWKAMLLCGTHRVPVCSADGCQWAWLQSRIVYVCHRALESCCRTLHNRCSICSGLRADHVINEWIISKLRCHSFLHASTQSAANYQNIVPGYIKLLTYVCI